MAALLCVAPGLLHLQMRDILMSQCGWRSKGVHDDSYSVQHRAGTQTGVTGVAQLLPQNTLTPWVNQDWRAEEAWDEADGDSFNLASSQE